MDIAEISKGYLEDLAQLFIELWPNSQFVDELEDCKAILKAKFKTCFLALDKNKPVGFIYTVIRHEYVEGASVLPIAYLEGIYVKQGYRETGVANKLLTAAERWALNFGINEMGSDCDIKNTLSIKFHMNNGFEEISRNISFIKKL